jgi:hypothetical protein
MTRAQIKRAIAENLEQLDSDMTTIIDGKVTATGIENRINYVYREELFPLFSDKFSIDFEQRTNPLNTYTTTGTVSASSTGTTLVAGSNIFSQNMVGFRVYNVIDEEFATITAYTSATTVTVNVTLGDTWDGDTIYVLGNEFTYGTALSDLKEIKRVEIKYASTDTEWIEMQEIDQSLAQNVRSTVNPGYYRTSLLVGDELVAAIGIDPYPQYYNGLLKITYIKRPKELSSDSDSPVLNVPGISQVIIDGVTAWGKGLKGEWDDADRYRAQYEGNPNSRTTGGKVGLIRNYKPKTRGQNKTVRSSAMTNAIRRRIL